MSEQEAFAFAWEISMNGKEPGNQVDVDFIAETIESLKTKVIETTMDWRYDYPDQYSHDEVWSHVLNFGKVVRVKIVQCEDTKQG